MVGMSIGYVSDKSLMDGINPGLTLHDNSFYPFNSDVSSFDHDFSSIVGSLFENNLAQAAVMYKVNILLTLLIISKS